MNQHTNTSIALSTQKHFTSVSGCFIENCVYVHVCVCECMCMCVYAYVCVCVYVCMYGCWWFDVTR